MEKNLQQTYQQLLEAVSPEEVFGLPGELTADETVKKVYRELSRIVHPDKNGDNVDLAKDAFAQLGKLHAAALKKIEKGTYGDLTSANGTEAEEFRFSTKKREYIVRSKIAEGDLSMVYSGEAVGMDGAEGKIVLKLINDEADNDFALNELRITSLLQAKLSPQSKHLPFCLDSFKDEHDRLGIVLRYFDGHDLMSLREMPLYKNGIAASDVAWMLERCLSALGHLHNEGIVHGNVEPTHILVRGPDHNVNLVDFSYAVLAGEDFLALNETYSPPEVAAKQPPTPASDIYALGKTMIFALGGEPATGHMPLSVPEKFQSFIRGMILPSQMQRLQDAWKIHKDLRELRRAIWGRQPFVPFRTQ